ncbi:hypothetical protein [Psychrobacillus sp. FJAT-21963]|uniref:hypothetical protein n=1 Tax=Psychrobacillus sp. FJAT-21963 TaxID=1712028 RepID=UPI0006F66148|nr:hypothetical protein [Psychrobacillus sp. FJAT-21963]KQL37154.1 hypothetical protein AN959_03695 [Psychrobacillus sp. FJAT-21963]
MRWSGEAYKNTSSKPLEVIQEDARIINVVTSNDITLKEQHEIAFVVSKVRSFEDYKHVSRHDARSKGPKLKLTPYSENLLESCFRGWN